MANPYHDETGRFCSKGDMQGAVQRLLDKGQLDEALVLASELKEITEANEGTKILKKVPQEKLDAWHKDLDSQLNRIRANGSHWNSLSQQTSNAMFGEHTDEELEQYNVLVLNEERKFKDEVLKPLADKNKLADEEFKRATGYDNWYALRRDREATQKEVETLGSNVLNEIRKKAIENGMDPRRAGYAFTKLKTELGLADTYYGSAGSGRSYTVQRPEETSEFTTTTLLPRLRDKAQMEILRKTVDEYVSNNQEKLDNYNSQARKLSTLKATERKVDMTSELHRSSELGKAKATAQAYESIRQGIQTHRTWRQNVRAAGVTSETMKIRQVSSITGNDLTVDETGKVNNAWIVKTPTDGGSPKVIRIVDVAPASDHGNLLVGEDGNTYRHFTHYHSYTKSVTDHDMIIDPKVSGTKNPAWDGAFFSSSVDSGD